MKEQFHQYAYLGVTYLWTPTTWYARMGNAWTRIVYVPPTILELSAQ